MVRLSSVAVAIGMLLPAVVLVVPMAARAAPALTINEVTVDIAAARIVVTGHDFGAGRGLEVTLSEIGNVTRVCVLRATSPQRVVCDFSDVGMPPAGDYRIALIAGRKPGENAAFDFTIGAPSAAPSGVDRWRTVEIAVGWYHVCVRRGNGTVTCWGDDSEGESTPPTTTFRQLAAGHVFNCGVEASRGVLCWGSDNTGQVSGVVAGLYSQVAGGSNHACGIHGDGSVDCWGYTFGPPPRDSFAQIAAGTGYTCGIRIDGTLACWGYNAYNLSPAPPGTYTHVASGPYHSCAVRSDGSVVCWGSNGSGQLGPAPAGVYTRVAAGHDFSCGVRTDGSVVCWGYDGYGQVSAAPSGSFSQIAAQGSHACGVKSDGSVACWGDYIPGLLSPPSAFP